MFNSLASPGNESKMAPQPVGIAQNGLENGARRRLYPAAAAPAGWFSLTW
jgi:hypothetical protein